MSTEPPPGVTVERAPFDHPDAAVLVAALDADLDRRYAHDDGMEAEPDRAMLNLLDHSVAPPLGAFLIARLGATAVGCGGIRPAPTGEAGAAEIKRMYVAPEARGRGVSRVLLAALEAEATSLGYRRIVLETGTRQHEAMALYESAGYVLVEPYGAYRASSLSRCYAKALASA